MTGDARSVVLARVRAALTDVPAEEAAAAETASGPHASGPGSADLFAERVADYRATVTRCAPEEVAEVVARVCARHGADRLVCPEELPAAWLAPGIAFVPDAPPLSAADLDVFDGVITGAAAAIADTGTILLDGGAASGRRAITLVPDLHICIVLADQIAPGVPEGLAAVHEAVRAGRPITMVSGPSATSDIELDRVEGVHGPRRLEVVLVA